MDRKDPYRNFKFRVEIDGVAVAHFSEMAIDEATTKPIGDESRAERKRGRKLPGLTKYGTITLKRGVADRRRMEPWLQGVSDGTLAVRKTVNIALRDKAADQARFVVSKAWPTKYDPSDLNAKGNEVIVELLELSNEGIERVR